MEKSGDLLASTDIDRDQLNLEDYPVPIYALKSNEVLRHGLFREAGAVKSGSVKFFEELCRYASSQGHNSGLIILDDFYSQLDTKTKAEFGDFKKISILLSKMMEKFGEDHLGVMTVLDSDEEGTIRVIALLEKGNEVESLYRKVERILLKNLQEVKEKKVQFKDYTELKKEFHLYQKELQSLVIEQYAKTINQQIIRDFSKKEKSLVVIKLEHDVGDIVVPAKKLGHLVTVFIELIYSYYQDGANDSLRKLIRKRIHRQKVEVETIVQAFREAQLNSPHFLFFSQLFYTIMNKLSEKFYTQNYISSEVVNQLIASRFLTLLSFNLREGLREEQVSKEKNQDLLVKVVDSLVTKSTLRSGKKIYYPATMADFLKVSIEVRDKSSQKKVILVKDELDVGTIEAHIAQLDSDKHTIPEVVRFTADGKNYYVHRVRLMQSFLAFAEVEKILIENKVLMSWVNDPQKILSKKDAEFFFTKVDKEYCSKLFLAFFLKIIEIFSLPSPISGKSFDSSYFLNRLFFDESEGLRFESQVGDLIFSVKDIERKKKILKAFFSTIFDKNYRPKSLHSILNIDFFDLRKKALDEAGIGFFYHLAQFFSGIFSKIFLNFTPLVDKQKKYMKGISDSLKSAKEARAKSSHSAEAKKEETAQKSSAKKAVVKKAKGGGLDGKAAQKVLLKDFPILKNAARLSQHLDELAAKWNYKIGDAKIDFQETIDDCISEFARRFDANAFSKEGKRDIIENFMNANHKIVNEVIDKKSFGEYFFYKAAFYKMK